jgi:hypothetical protein
LEFDFEEVFNRINDEIMEQIREPVSYIRQQAKEGQIPEHAALANQIHLNLEALKDIIIKTLETYHEEMMNYLAERGIK